MSMKKVNDNGCHLIRKLKSEKGASLVEMLCATLILLLLSMVLVTGVTMAYKHYTKSVRASEATELLCTLEIALSNELKYTNAMTTDAQGNVQSFRSVTYAIKEDQEVRLVCLDDDGAVTDFGEPALGSDGIYQRILSTASYPHGLKAKASITYTAQENEKLDGCFTVTMSIGTDREMLLEDQTFQVRAVNLDTWTYPLSE